MVVFEWKLEIAHKQVGGCVIAYSLSHACVGGYLTECALNGLQCRVDYSETING